MQQRPGMQKHNFRKILYSRHFRSSILLLLLIYHIILGNIVFFEVQQFKNNTSEKSQSDLTNIIYHLEKELYKVKESFVFAGSLPAVNKLLRGQKAEMDDWLALDKAVVPLVHSMSYDSLVIFFSKSGNIYDSKAGLYTPLSFYDKELLKRFSQRNENEYFEYGYPHKRYYKNDSDASITYVRALPLYTLDHAGFAAVYLPVSTIINQFANSVSLKNGEIACLFFGDQLIWSSSSGITPLDNNFSNKYCEEPSYTFVSSVYPRFKASMYLPRHFFFQKFSRFFPLSVFLYVLGLFLNIAGALAYSYYHLNQFNTFLHNIQQEGSLPFNDFSSGQITDLANIPFGPVRNIRKYNEFQIFLQLVNDYKLQINTIKQSVILPQFVSAITLAIASRDLQKLNTAVDDFYLHYISADLSLQDAKKTILIAVSNIFSSLLELKIPFSIHELNHVNSQIEGAESLVRLKDIFYAHLAGLADSSVKISKDAHCYIRKAVNYLENHFDQAISVSQVAEHVNISSVYLSRLFKLQTGKTLSEYLNCYRMDKSRDMLLNTSMTINDISRNLGYNDVRSYIRFFKKLYGITPNSFRKQNAAPHKG